MNDDRDPALAFERERDEAERSPAQPLGSDRIDDDDRHGVPGDAGEMPHVKTDGGRHMEN